MWMNNVRTQNVLKVSPSFNIEQLLPCLCLYFFFIHLHLSLSLSLRSGVSLSGSVLQRRILQLPPAPGPEQKPRSSLGGGRLGQKTQPTWKQKRLSVPSQCSFSILIWSLFLFAELVSLFVSAQLPGPFGSLRHWLFGGLGEYLLAWDDQMFMCRCISPWTTVSPD